MNVQACSLALHVRVPTTYGNPPKGREREIQRELSPFRLEAMLLEFLFFFFFFFLFVHFLATLSHATKFHLLAHCPSVI